MNPANLRTPGALALGVCQETLERDFRPCEVVYILSELAKLQSLAMLQREQEAI
jgi:hypothetical protein